MARRNATGRPMRATVIIGVILLLIGVLGTVAGIAQIGAQLGTWALILASLVFLAGIFYPDI